MQPCRPGSTYTSASNFPTTNQSEAGYARELQSSVRPKSGGTGRGLACKKAATGTVQVAESFAPFGARRGSAWQGAPSAADLTAIGNSTPDGFTGHEMLDGVGLIHMRGRVYDPTVGRFLSVDPIVRDIDASQSWNGYGYVSGRVMSATDPSGFMDTLPGKVRPDDCAAVVCVDGRSPSRDTSNRLNFEFYLNARDRQVDLSDWPVPYRFEEVVVTDSPIPEPVPPPVTRIAPIVSVLCGSSGVANLAEDATTTAGNIGDAAESLVPAAALGSAVTAPSRGEAPALRTPWPNALPVLGNGLKRVLSTVGLAGQIGSVGIALLDLADGNPRRATFTMLDATFYSAMGALGVTGVSTAGSTTALALAASSMYLATGGSEGIVGNLCGR